MRLFVFTLLFAALLPVGRSDGPSPDVAAPDPFTGMPDPLAEALRAYTKDAPRWAYTQRVTQFDRKGVMKGGQVSRYDPSQHYDVQWTLLEQDGQTATERQQKKFRQERAKLQQKRQPLGELLQLDRATLVEGQPDSADFLTYEVPLRPGEDMRLPPEKFQVFVKIACGTHQLHAIDVRLRGNLRVGGVVNVKSGEAHLKFEGVKPEFGPAPAFVSASGSVFIFFIPLGGRTEVTRSDFRRVTPYDDRFKVKLGALKLIDF